MKGPVGAIEMGKLILQEYANKPVCDTDISPPPPIGKLCIDGPDFKATATCLAMACNLSNK